MRTGRSALVAALSGALALGAFTAQPAHAAATGIKVSNVVVNKGKPMVVGTSDTKYPTVSYRVTWPAGYTISTATTNPFMYHGTTPAKAYQASGNQLFHADTITCYEDGTRAANCQGTLRIRPRENLDSAKDATTWKLGAVAFLEKKGGKIDHEYLSTSGTLQVKRAARATVNASPEPVVKNKTLTVTGKLTRADWAKRTYAGYGNKLAKLQFRKAGTSTYTTVKTVRANSSGNLKTTVKATVDGYWRWTFGQTATTGGATAAGDYVDVK
ncbi:hypothetical protein ACFTXK_05770 [Streptomyces sp. NPDC056956]|uniref:hypothetical protein n=1 Tax=unclassified Streptomyces TaxID=2593676 RepID=UPI001942C014|nr:hypothetical protein [Streptomyces sp. SID9913]MBM7087065.1 hypothetical protein [Streptomyces sp. S12]